MKDELERMGDAGKPDDKVNEALKLIKIKVQIVFCLLIVVLYGI